MSGKRQPDAHIKHMGKKKNPMQDSEKGIFKRPFGMIKPRQMWKSALAFVKLNKDTYSINYGLLLGPDSDFPKIITVLKARL